MFDGLIHGYSPALKSKSKEMNLKWKTKPPHQPKGGRPWKIDIQRDVSISSSTNTLTGGMGRARRCGTVPEKVEGLDQVDSYVRESTRCIAMSLRNKYTLFDTWKMPLLL